MLKGQDGADGEDKLINQADGSGLSFWIGTQAEYDAIPSQELVANCVYYITDNTADDLRTDINAIDTKVDNNYNGLQNQIMSTRSYLIHVMDQVVAQMTALEQSQSFQNGDSGTIYYNTGGYITTNSTQILFSIPLPKTLPDELQISGLIKVRLRQGGKYVGGSTAESPATFDSDHSTISVNNKIARITLFNSPTDVSFSNAINNDAIGIECQFEYNVKNV